MPGAAGIGIMVLSTVHVDHTAYPLGLFFVLIGFVNIRAAGWRACSFFPLAGRRQLD
jgi:hypothetical protein